MSYDPGLGEQLSTGALSAFQNSIANVNLANNNLAHAMGMATVNITQIGGLTGAAILLSSTDPGRFAALNTASGIPASGAIKP